MLGEKIKELRTFYNYSQVQLAKKLGVSKQSISNWENNNIVPSIEILKKIALLFHVTSDFLLGIDNRHMVEFTGLSLRQIAYLNLLLDDTIKAQK